MKCLENFKRGDSLILVCTYKVDDVPAPISGKIIESQIRRSNGNLVATMDVEADEENPAKFILTPDTSTSEFPLEALLCDIQITEDDIVRSSETIQFTVVEDITQ
jgi:hypothetical protein